MALNFLQQLDGKLAALSIIIIIFFSSCRTIQLCISFIGRIEEAACKRIADLEVELQRVAHSEKRSASKASELEQQYQQHQLIMKVLILESKIFLLLKYIFILSLFTRKLRPKSMKCKWNTQNF